MNVHDSERLSGLLEDAGYVRDRDAGRAGRRRRRLQHVRGAGERRQQALRQPVSHLAPVKAASPGMQIAVGGCLAQKDRATITDEGARTSTSSSAPTTSARCRCCSSGRGSPRRRRSRSSSRCRSSPRRCPPSASRRTPPGCPSRSGATTPARSASCRRCAARRRTAGPARSSPRSRRSSPRASPRSPCWGRTSTPTASSSATARRSPSCCARAVRSRGWSGCASPRPHPAEFTDDVIEAMAETPNVMPSLHMPLQSGSDAVLRAMRRSYRQSKYLGIIERVRAAIPDAAITTDIIVGFPGETEEDFQATLDVVRAARFSGRLHLPVLQASRHPGRRSSRTRSRRRSSRTATSGSSRSSTRSPGRRTRRSSAAPSS